MSVLVSGLSLAGIALDRYQAVSINHSRSIISTLLVIVTIDTFAVIMALPYVNHMKVEQDFIIQHSTSLRK